MKTCLFSLVLSFSVIATVSGGADPRSGQQRLTGIGMLVFTGRAAEAKPQIAKALEAYRAESNPAGEGICLMFLGLADIALQDSAAGKAELEQSTAKLRQSGDVFSAFMTIWMRSELEARDGKSADSLALQESALDLLRQAAAPDAPFKLDGFQLMGPMLGMDLSMVGPLIDNPLILKPILLSLCETIIRDSYGKSLIEVGRLDDAERELTRAASLDVMLSGMFESSIQAHLGDLRRRQWRLDEARQSYEKALEGIKPMSMLPARDEWLNVSILGELSSIDLLRGRADDALAWNDKALALLRSGAATPDAPKREASVLDDRAEIFMRQGRFAEAESEYDKALKIAEKIGDMHLQALVLSSLGTLNLTEGRYGNAASFFERSVELFQKAHDVDAETAAWISLAEVYFVLDASDSARDALAKAHELASKSSVAIAPTLVTALEKVMAGDPSSFEQYFGSLGELPETKALMPAELRALIRETVGLPPEAPSAKATPEPSEIEQLHHPTFEAMADLLRGRMLFQRGDRAGARALWLKALDKDPNRDLRVGYLAAIGASYWSEGDETHAFEYFERAAKAIEAAIDDIKVEEVLANYLGSNRRWYFEITIEMLARKGRIREAFDLTERARARAFLQTLGNNRLRPTGSAEKNLVHEAEALREKINEWERRSAFAPVSVAEDLRHAQERYEAVMKRVKVSNPEYASVIAVEPLQLEDVQRELAPDTTLISYFVTTSRVHAWVIDRQSIDYIALPADKTRLQRTVCWARMLGGSYAVGRGMIPVSERCPAPGSAEEAFEMLIGPLRNKIHNARLILVPHGDLHYVPFAALRDPKTKRYLLEDYTLLYAPSASSLRFLRQKETPLDGSALVLGDPATASPQYARLSGAQREAIVVAKKFGVTPKVGAQASEGLLYGLNGKFDLIHIGAHGTYDPDHPLFSRIAFAKDAAHDGNLEVHEILSDVDFSGVNLVVLSACQTARGTRSGGDEIVGLTRAVLYAGSPGVISTLWDIDDDATADLMDDFYDRLLAGAPVAEALRQAQLSLMKRAPYSDPKFWAAFNLTGDPQARWQRPVPPRRPERTMRISAPEKPRPVD